MKIKAIITGSTGMVGEGVLLVCLEHPEVESVLVVNRRPCGVSHPKLKEIIHRDFSDITPIKDELAGYNACYYCMGVSSIGKKEDEYTRITYDITMHFAETLAGINKDMVFSYISGVGTDSTEEGRSMWARVKGRTENDLLRMPFRDAYMYRPGYIHPIKGQKNAYTMYKILSPFYPVFRKLFPKYVTTMKELALSMVNTTLHGSEKKVLECKDIVETSGLKV